MQKWDHELYAELLTLPKFPFLRMVRQDRRALSLVRRDFFANGTVPSFVYPLAERFDADGYLVLVEGVEERIKKNTAPPELTALYLRKCQELRLRAACVRAMQRRDDTEVTRIAATLFGKPAFTLAMLRQEREERKKRIGFVHLARVNATLFAEMVRRTLDHYSLHDWRVRIVARHSVQIGHGKRSRSPVIRVPKTLLISKQRAVRLLMHEIEVHALRTANGAASPLHILERGCAGYIAADEGLAMYMTSPNPSINGGALQGRKSLGGFWEAYTAALTKEYALQDVFDELAEATTRAKAWRLCVRAYRGIHAPNKPGLGFLRDHVYRSGLITITQALQTQGATLLPQLFAGNAGLDDLPALCTLGVPPGKLPDMVSKKIVRDVLRTSKKVDNSIRG